MNRTIQTRRQYLVNTDPQRRCYNGCHFSSKLEWTSWTDLDTVSEVLLQERLSFWKELNQIAVDGRGEGARKEFRVTL